MAVSLAKQNMKQSVLLGIIGGIVTLGAVVIGAAYYLTSSGVLSPTATAAPPTASASAQGVAVGASFPSFRLSEVDGTPVTNETLLGKPAILWFTTSWCVPCQIGAQDVARLDTSFGDDKFEVIVIFVDPRETPDDLTGWRRRFGNDDWQVAFDNPRDPIAKKVNLRFLDSKYLLDANGIVQNIDFQIVTDDYIDVVTQVVDGA